MPSHWTRGKEWPVSLVEKFSCSCNCSEAGKINLSYWFKGQTLYDVSLMGVFTFLPLDHVLNFSGHTERKVYHHLEDPAKVVVEGTF